ncbi:hypothetical protein B5804_08700 [Gilliamella apicola]|nr:hypothetical protein B5804_08700 [Gilliamella apicola]
MLTEISRASTTNFDLLNKRFLICLNDNVPYDKKNALRDSDIEDFLERKIDFVRKFVPSIDKFKKASESAEIKEIAAAIIGNKAMDDNQQKAIFPLLKKKTSNF